MPVKHPTNQPRRKNRHGLKNPVVPTNDSIGVGNKLTLPQIIFHIRDFFLGRPQRQLEPAQTIIGQRRFPQVQTSRPALRQPFHCRPHDEIAGPQRLPRHVRSPVFVNRPVIFEKINRGGDFASLMAGHSDHAQILRQNIPVDVPKKSEGWRWQTMPFARQAM